jgi:predicted HicB family RNase H-like nuclease
MNERNMVSMAIKEAQRKAVRKYKEKAYDRLEISVVKGKKTSLQAHAVERGESLNGFVNRAIDEAVARDKSAQPTDKQEAGKA